MIKRLVIVVSVLSCALVTQGLAAGGDEAALRAAKIERLRARNAEGQIRPLSLSSCALKAVLSCGSNMSSALTTSSCLDSATDSRGERYTIDATVGQIIGVEMSSSAFSTFLLVEGPGFFLDFGNTLSFLSSGQSTERIDFYVPETGTYTIEAESLYGPSDSSPSTGAYTLKVSCFAAAPSCVNANTLCLNAGRFHVTLSARDQRSGNTGTGLALPTSDLFGYFSIPALTNNPGNPEVFVKMLDARTVNGKFWVFYNGLTDLEYTLTVVDTATGVTKTYVKEAGSTCGGFDTSAF